MIKLELKQHELELMQENGDNEDLALPPVLDNFQPLSETPGRMNLRHSTANPRHSIPRRWCRAAPWPMFPHTLYYHDP